jgi:hypothetical protein
MTATTEARYASIEPLPLTTGSNVQRQMGSMRARLVARYKLVAVPGRPEELEQTRTGKRVSLGYGCKTVRVRKQAGREWLDRIDLQIAEGWHAEVYAFLDAHFEYRIPTLPTMEDQRRNIVN